MSNETTVHTVLMGAHFRGADDKDHLSTLIPGAVLQLVAEPTNPYDNNAIAVMSEGFHIGYIQKEVAADTIASTIKDGTCTILGFDNPQKPVLEFIVLSDQDADSEASA